MIWMCLEQPTKNRTANLTVLFKRSRRYSIVDFATLPVATNFTFIFCSEAARL